MKKAFSLIVTLCVFSHSVIASPSINNMQSCQGLLDFIDSKFNPAPSQYPADDVIKVRKGLQQYNDYIQQDIITPGLLKYNNGDIDKTTIMQQQVDVYKETIVKSLQSRYPQHRIFTDQAIAVNNCAQQAVPSGQALEELKTALETMVKLAKLE